MAKVPKHVKDAVNAVRSLKNILKQFKNIKWFRVPRVKYIHSGPPIGLLHIDGDHRYPNPLEDFLHLEKYMTPSSFVVFHDYNEKHQGVVKSVKELLKKKKIVQEYKGNSIFVGKKVDNVWWYQFWRVCNY